MRLAELPNITIQEATKRNNPRRLKFKAALERLGKSQAEVAAELGVDESTISRYISGSRNPSLSSLRKLAKQGIDVSDIFGMALPGPDESEPQLEPQPVPEIPPQQLI